MILGFATYDSPECLSGPTVWLRRLLPELRALGIECQLFILTLGDPDKCPNVAHFKRQGFRCAIVPKAGDVYADVRHIVRALASNPVDVFIPNLITAGYYAGRWVRAAGIPTIGVIHSDAPFYLRGLRDQFVRGPAAFRVSAVVCVSAYLEQWFRQNLPPTIRLERIPCGVPIARLHATPPGDSMTVAYVGRLVTEAKRAPDVARALCSAAAMIPGVEGVLYGDGDARAEVERILAAEGAGLPVRLGGLIDPERLYDVVSRCHALALLSDYEGLPVAVMEAMACGVVPICLDVRSGIGELVIHRKTGLIVPDRGPGFVAAVRCLREEPGLWQRLSRAARERVAIDYGNEACASKWLSLCHELVNAGGPRHPLLVPKRIALPPLHPALGWWDTRPPSLTRRLLERVRMTFGYWKNRLLRPTLC